ncbi:MAG: L-threonylcarbamoyladenylate synthase [Polyangia bacterium]
MSDADPRGVPGPGEPAARPGQVVPATAEGLAAAAALLRAGEVVAFPTETVYGLGADATRASAIERIYALKGRPRHNPLIVHVADAETAAALAGTFSDTARELAARFWPGPLTLVVPRGPRIPSVVSAGLDTVALRVPAHPVALQLLRTVGLPLAAPSANRSESLSPTTAAHVLRSLPAVPLVVDGGPCWLGIESTVVDLVASPPRLLRPGALPLRSLLAVLPQLALPAPERSLGPDPTEAEAAPSGLPSPGMMARHYAPRAALTLLDDTASEAQLVAQVGALPAPRGLLTYRPLPALAPLCAQVELLPAEPSALAADLYAALHRLDDAGVASIAALRPPAGLDFLAISDRLRRAAHR